MKRKAHFLLSTAAIIVVSLGTSCKTLATKFEPVDIASVEPQWETKIEARNLSEDEFTRLAASCVRSKIPVDAKLKIAGPLEIRLQYSDEKTDSSVFYLDNVWKATSDQPGERKNILERYVANIESSATFMKEVENGLIDKIVPLVRREDQFDGVDPKWRVSSVTEKLGANLILVYGIDGGNSITYLTPELRKKLKLDDKQMREKAIQNFRKLVENKTSLEAGPLVSMFSCGGDYESSLLLSQNSMKIVSGHIKMPIVFAIPNRDVFLCTGAYSKPGIERLREITQKSFSESDHPVSDDLYRFDNGKISFFEKSPGSSNQ